jgi:isochorismate pyruvate lyase
MRTMTKLWTAAPLLLLGLGLAAAADEPDPNRPAYRGTPGAAGGTCCQTLGEARSHIDSIDRQIIALMAERSSYVIESGRFKADPNSVADPKRVDQIVAKMRALAEKANLSPDVAEATYRAMIGAFTEDERKHVEQDSQKH